MKLKKRRKTPAVQIGSVSIGSRHRIAIQSMTNTPTANIPQTVKQITELIKAGSDMVRITVNNDKAASAIPQIIKAVRQKGHGTPIIGDFHYNGHLLLRKHPQMATLLDKYRINPGNIGKGTTGDDNFAEIIQIAVKNNKAVRIGVNWGSLDQELLKDLMDKNAKTGHPHDPREIIYRAMIQSALHSAKYAIKLGLKRSKLVLSVKMSELQDMVTVYSRLAKECDYALHLGLTEAGSNITGITSSAAALAILLQQGIGDTIRISLTPQPKVPRWREVEVCKSLLQSMGLRYFAPKVTSCPGCGRTQSDYFQKLADEITDHIHKRLSVWKKNYPGVERLTIAVMGCVVNGPGESKHADIGISLPGNFEKPAAPVYIEGNRSAILSGKNIEKKFVKLLEDYIQKRFR